MKIITQSKAEIEKIGTVSEAAELAGIAKAAHLFYAAKGWHVRAQRAKEYYYRIARRAGVLLSEVERDPGGPNSFGNKRVTAYQEAMEQAGITPYIANTWQQIAQIPADDFEAYLTDPKKEHTEYTTAALLRLIKESANYEQCTCPECGAVHRKKG